MAEILKPLVMVDMDELVALVDKYSNLRHFFAEQPAVVDARRVRLVTDFQTIALTIARTRVEDADAGDMAEALTHLKKAMNSALFAIEDD